jgi:2,3,4,5-tetrahydropyridine-2,6-dicarboxylate N-succinyltransferase
MQVDELKAEIESAFDRRTLLSGKHLNALKPRLSEILDGLETGTLRVAEPSDGGWIVNEWLKKAVLLSFRAFDNAPVTAGDLRFYDKVALQFSHYEKADFERLGARVVPGAIVRRGAHIATNAVLMPSFVNIGAYVGANTMVDAWATVGSCAQIGSNVHLSGGVGIGGVLEPLQAAPTIIEDDCFIGARSEIVEGVVVERGAVISMGVYIGQSTRIYNRLTGETTRGRVPAGAVVVPGNLPSADGSHSLYAAIIVKLVDQATREKTALNELLRAD